MTEPTEDQEFLERLFAPKPASVAFLHALHPDDNSEPVTTDTPAYDGGAHDREPHNPTADYNAALANALKPPPPGDDHE